MKQAFTHRSANKKPRENYERLEFLGDAVLDIVVSELLMQEFPAGDEGMLTQKRSALVQQSFLSTVGESLSLLDYFKIEKSIDITVNKIASKQSANLVEALIGAMYKDGGLEPCRKIINRVVWGNRHEAWKSTNYKGRLIEYCHSKSMESPSFHTTNVSGPDHNKMYEIHVSIGARTFLPALEDTKKAAEQTAAANALVILEGRR